MSNSNPIRSWVSEIRSRTLEGAMPDIRLVCPTCGLAYNGSANIDGHLVCCCQNYHIWSGE